MGIFQNSNLSVGVFKTTNSDLDANAFISATGISDGIQKIAINELVVDLKGYSIWTKMKAVYPMVGGTATTHKYNLINPADTNGAFRLLFQGGWTHSSTGALPNGSTGYAITYISPANLTENSTHMSYYSRSNTVGPMIDMGIHGGGPPTFNLLLRYTGGIYEGYFSDQYNFNTNRINAVTNLDSRGFYVSSRTTSTVHKGYKNGAQIGSTDTNASSGFSSLTGNLTIGARNDLPAANYSNRECAFSSIGDGLTDSDVNNLNIAVQKFQTTLGRQV